ncbi:MAG: CapA family protein [Lachnospiraceae bacterium]|nr:CapA family protein [Lachnospiraceae bacterium]
MKTKIVWFILLALVLTSCKGDPRKEDVLAETTNSSESMRESEIQSSQPESSQPSEVPSQEPSTEEPSIQEPEIVTLTISAAGDVTLGKLHTHSYDRTLNEYYDKNGPEYFFRDVKPIFEADDMTIVNFEGVLTLTDDRVEKTFNMKGDPEYVNILKEGNIEAVSFANNHRMDYGQQGSDDTIAAFEEAEIAYAYDSYIGYYEAKGLTVGFVSINQVYDSRKVIEGYLESGINQLKEEGVDLIIACCHWGAEKKHYPNDYQTKLGQMCIDWGADLVIGHHPHVLQGVDEYKGKYIVYSLGNFCFGGNKNPQIKDTMIYQQTFTFVDGEKQEDAEIRIIPCYISSARDRNDYQPTLAEGDEIKRIIDQVNTYSEAFGVRFDEEGYLVQE